MSLAASILALALATSARCLHASRGFKFAALPDAVGAPIVGNAATRGGAATAPSPPVESDGSSAPASLARGSPHPAARQEPTAERQLNGRRPRPTDSDDGVRNLRLLSTVAELQADANLQRMSTFAFLRLLKIRWEPLGPSNQPDWLDNAKDFGFTVSDKRKPPPFAFGGRIGNRHRHAAWMCAGLRWHGSSFAGPLMTACAGVGCDCVVQPFLAHVRLLAASHGLHPSNLWCRLVPSPEERQLTWEIAASLAGASLFRVLLAPERGRGEDSGKGGPFAGGCRVTNRLLLTLRDLGPWYLNSAAGLSSVLEAQGRGGLPSTLGFYTTATSVYLGFHAGVADRAYFCWDLRWHGGCLRGAVRLSCRGRGCNHVLYSVLRYSKAEDAWQFGVECRIVPNDRRWPSVLLLDFITFEGLPLTQATTLRLAPP